MDALRGGNLGLRFALELGMLVGVGWWGYHEEGWLTAVALAVAFALVWGAFLSPKARFTIPRVWRLGLELLVFGLGAAAWYGAGHGWVGVGFAVAAAVHEALFAALRQRP